MKRPSKSIVQTLLIIAAVAAGAIFIYANSNFTEKNDATNVEQTINLSHATRDILLDDKMLFLEDPTNSLTIGQLISSNSSHDFKPLPKKHLVFGYLENTLWLKTTVKNVSASTHKWNFNVIGNRLSVLNSFIVRDGLKTEVLAHGYKTDKNNMGCHFTTPAIDLKLAPQETVTIYLQIKCPDILKLQIRIQNEMMFHEHETLSTMFVSIYFGSILSLILYHLFLYISLRDINYLNYIIFAFSMLLISLTYLGYADYFQLNWKGFYWQEHLAPLRAFIPITALLFLRSFLKTSKTLPKVDYAIKVFLVWSAFCVVMFTAFWGHKQLPIIDMNTLIAIIFILSTSITLLIKGFKPARFFLAGWGFFVTMIIVWTMTNAGMLEVNFFTRYAAQIGNLGEVILMALALADRIKSLSTAKMAAEVKAAEAEVSKRLVRVMCHDISNPAAVIEGSCKLAAMKKDPESSARYWGSVSRANETILSIVDHVRKMEKLGSGKSSLNVVPVNLSSIIDNSEFIFKQKLEDKKIQFKTPSSDELSKISVYADAVSLSNDVVNNLISNGIKFTKENGDVTISVKENENSVTLTITDGGIGIPDELLKDVFSLTKNTSRRGTNGETGTGFGMPLVKEYVEQFGGKIEIESKDIDSYPEEHGTSVHVTLKKVA